ncbi:MAG: hypothetical protein H6667_12010 [Ardenticatenaceae bacterium]|nr:hypothetical protein [Ardenticatenaceae bacterium]
MIVVDRYAADDEIRWIDKENYRFVSIGHHWQPVGSGTVARLHQHFEPDSLELSTLGGGWIAATPAG